MKQRQLLNLHATIRGRWVRVAVYWGPAPGSNMGFWRTRGGYTGNLQGLNYRVGSLSRCLTALIHTRRWERS